MVNGIFLIKDILMQDILNSNQVHIVMDLEVLLQILQQRLLVRD